MMSVNHTGKIKRIRVVHHPLHVNLLVAVRTRLLLTHDAPAADAELVKSGWAGQCKAEILKILREESTTVQVSTKSHIISGKH